MMMIPRRKNEFDLLGEVFADPFFTEHESKIMKTDIREKKDKYLIDIDLPGYQKENIKMEVEDGYLTIHAEINSDNEEKEEGKFVRREIFRLMLKKFLYRDRSKKWRNKSIFQKRNIKNRDTKKRRKERITRKEIYTNWRLIH